MAELSQAGGRPVIDYMARDYDSLLRAMRELVPGKLPEWRDFTNEADFGNVLLELFAHMGDILSYYQDRVANESFLATARTRRSVIQHLRLIGYELGTAAPATTLLALSVPRDQRGTVTVEPGDAFATTSTKDRPSLRFEYLGEAPLTIDFDALKADPNLKRKVFGAENGAIPVHEGRLFRQELLGSSDGTANQRFRLVHPRLLLRPPGADRTGDLRVETHLGDDRLTWTRQQTLAFSQAGQRDYVVEIDDEDRATLVFGDGVFGAIPPPGAEIRATYRVGGGQAGNVPPLTVTTIAGAAQLAVVGAKVFNPLAASGGADREDITHAVRQAPAVFRSLHRAVTAADYEALALRYNGVAKARAAATRGNTVTLFVAPQGEGQGKVSDVLHAGLLEYFEDKRMLGQIVEIVDVDYIAVQVTVEIGIERLYVPDEVVARVQRAAAALLAFDRVGFDETLHLSRFYDAIQDVPGVAFANITEFRRADGTEELAPHGRLDFHDNELPSVPKGKDYAQGLKIVRLDQGRR